MRRRPFAILSLVVALLGGGMLLLGRAVHAQAPGGTSQPRAEARSPFRVLDVYVDTGTARLAAYQFEFATAQGGVGELKLVGMEGGEATAFREPPRYDPRALAQPVSRLVVAAFNTGDDLPAGRTRVARLMVRVPPGTADLPAQLQGRLTAAADAGAKPIAGAKLQIVEGALR